MRESLSIIFPVRDRQSEIKKRVEGLLDLLCELSQEVQLIVVDDRSEDATPEVLDELRRKYGLTVENAVAKTKAHFSDTSTLGKLVTAA